MREVYLDCECGRTVNVVVDFLSDEIHVPDIRTQYRCSVCGHNFKPPGAGVL